MKSVYFYLFAAVALLFASCSDDDDMNTTGATVSFEQAEYSFAESAVMVNVPLKVEGERNGNIVVHLKVTDGTAISEGHYIVTSETINIPADSEDEVFNVEIRVLDDGNEENDDRYFSIAIESVEGATAGAVSSCNVILLDVDKNPYYKLFGEWTVSAIDATSGEPATWEMTISDSYDGESYAEQYLVCTDFEGDDGAPMIMKYSKDGTLEVVEGILYAAYNFGSFIGACAVEPLNASGRPESGLVIPATYNNTFDEIVFDTSAGFVGISVYEYNTSNGAVGSFMGRLSVFRMQKMVKK